MSVTVERRRFGAWTVLVLSRNTVEGHRLGKCVWLRGYKRPCAVVLARDGLVQSFDAAGQRIPLAAVKDMGAEVADHVSRLSNV